MKEVYHDQHKHKKKNPTGDRKISCFIDSKGCHGKTWLSLYLYERGLACIVPRASCTAEKISSYVCSSYKGEPYIIIDIPRSRKITGELYEAIEELKDGLVFDHRYRGRARNVRGIYLIIFTNKELDLKKLSHDRWCLHGIKTDKHD